MNKESKNRWMIWAIVVLAAMNVSTLATILYHQYQQDQVKNESRQQLETDAEKFSGRYFRDRLNLDGEQMNRFRQINPVFRQQARAVTLDLAAMRKQMLTEMASPESDTLKLNALSDSIGSLHRQLKRLTYRYYIDLKHICNPEQRRQLEQLFQEMFTNDLPMGFPGRGGYGRPHGKMNFQ